MNLEYILCSANKTIVNSLEERENGKDEEKGWIQKKCRFLLQQPNCWSWPLWNGVQRDRRNLGGGGNQEFCFRYIMLQVPIKHAKRNEESHLFHWKGKNLKTPCYWSIQQRHLLWQEVNSWLCFGGSDLIIQRTFFSEGPWDIQMYSRDFSGYRVLEAKNNTALWCKSAPLW